MPVKWTVDLATGHARIDAQHRQLYEQVAALHEAMHSHQLDRVPEILDFLQRYVDEHFALEEREMAAVAYTGLGEHHRLHQRFVADFLRHRAALSEGITAGAVVELSHWITEWLSDHIRRVDVEMARHLRKRGGD